MRQKSWLTALRKGLGMDNEIETSARLRYAVEAPEERWEDLPAAEQEIWRQAARRERADMLQAIRSPSRRGRRR